MIYRTVIEDNGLDFTQSFSAGTELIDIAFRFSFVTAEIYSNVLKAVEMRRESIPLYDGQKEEVIRDYDYITYWMSIPTTLDEIRQWLETSPVVPFFTKTMTENTTVYKMREEAQFVAELYKLLSFYEEQLYWLVTLTKGDETIVSSIRPGGTVYFKDKVAVTFLSDRASIGMTDLGTVTLQVEVPNE